MERVAGPGRERSPDEAPEEPPAEAPPTDLLVPPPLVLDAGEGELATGALVAGGDVDAVGAPVDAVGAPVDAPSASTPRAAAQADDWLAVGPAAAPPPAPRIVLRPSARLAPGAPPPPATGRIPNVDLDSLVAPARDDVDAPPPGPLAPQAGPPPPATAAGRPFDPPEAPLPHAPPTPFEPAPPAPFEAAPPAPFEAAPPAPLEAAPPTPRRTGRLNIRILPRGAGGAPPLAAGPPPAFAIGSPVEDVAGAATARGAPRAPTPAPAGTTGPTRTAPTRPVTARVQGRVQTGLGGRVRAALRCPYCHDGVERQGGVACARRGCGALYHEACWRECVSHYGGCAVFGCGCRDVRGLTRVGLWVRVARLVLAAVLFPPRVIEALRDEGAGAEEVRRALDARANETDDAFWARTSTRVAPRTRAAWNLLQFAVPCVAMAVTMALLTGTGAIFSRPEAAILLMIAAGIGAVLALHQTSRVAALIVYYSRAVLDGEFAALARAGGVGGYLTRMRTGGQKPGAPGS